MINLVTLWLSLSLRIILLCMNPDILRYDLESPNLPPPWKRGPNFMVGGCRHGSSEQARELKAPGFDFLEGQMIPIDGIWGGGLRHTTGDGFRLAAQAPDWPYERIVMESSIQGRRESRTLVLDNLITTLVAFGFSTSSDLMVFMRDSA